MTKLTEIESKYLDLKDGSLSVKAFEQWVYQSDWLEKVLSDEEYLELIALDYNKQRW